MPRKRVVTRSIKVIEALCLVLNTETGEIFERTFTLPYKSYKKNEGEKLLRDFVEEYDTDKEKIKGIILMEVKERIYGMSEKEFVRKATIFSDDRKMPTN